MARDASITIDISLMMVIRDRTDEVSNQEDIEVT
jgi:hypothetical protein